MPVVCLPSQAADLPGRSLILHVCSVQVLYILCIF